MFITPAFAQTAAAQPGMNDILLQMAPFGLILVIMYFLILRPQQRKLKAHQELVKGIRRGDTIVTSGGIIGKVTKATEDSEVEVEVAPNVRIRVIRQMVSDVRTKGEPVKE